MSIRQVAGVAAVCLVCMTPAVSQASGDSVQGTSTQASETQSEEGAAQDATEAPVYEEQVVVSASKAEEQLINAPATVSLITSEQIESAPALNYGDLLRSVPGVNVTQTSARDINLTSRGATGTLSTSQLALVDGRSIYLDFFGFVGWDFLPINPAEIKQIEVIRGPASAVWGANALSGVVNVITKSPREMQGSTLTVGVGAFERSTSERDADAGTLFYVSGTHAQAVNERWAYKLTAGAFSQDAFARPSGLIPNGTGIRYPDYPNSGTTQPKFDVRVDRDLTDNRKLVFQGGIAGTEGIMHTGIGPFDIDRGTTLGYGRVAFSRGPMKLTFFVNVLNGDATNLLSADPLGSPIGFQFDSQTWDVEFGNVQTVAGRHVLTYGGNLRRNQFDLSIAPDAEPRTEGGGYVQDEIFLTNQFRWVVGGRLDKFDIIDNVQFSPRTAFLYKPKENQTVRVSYNRAYRAPSAINNYLDTVISEPLNLGLINPALAGRIYRIPFRVQGDRVFRESHGGVGPELVEQSVTAFEVGYSGVVRNRATVTAAWYYNETKDDTFFTEVTSERWTASNPPPGWPLPPGIIALLPGGSFPATFSYRNFGKVKQKGIELGVDGAINRALNAFVNYSYQPEPDANFAKTELNLPAEHRFNIGGSYSDERFIGNLSVSYSSSAFWQDVLDARYSGRTDAYTLVNAAFGVRWRGNRFTAMIKVNNLLNDEIQQHVFGDVIKRQAVAELRVGI
jgi:outer membrane receptor protein involved in Fe transport